METSIPVLFDRLMACIEACEPRAREVLMPGVTPEEIARFQQETGILLPDAVAEVYRITSGVDQEAIGLQPVEISFPGYWMHAQLTLDDMAQTLEDFVEAEYVVAEERTRYLPLFADGSGEYICIDTADGNSVVDFPDDAITLEERVPMFRSLPSMLSTITAFYEEGAFYPATDGTVGTNAALLRQIGIRCEGLPYWQDKNG